MTTPRLRFLGTGASGGTPGRGRSGRMESSAVVEADRTVLLDVTRDFDRQSGALDDRLEAILLTHAHRDASGGVGAKLRRWWQGRGLDPIRVLAHPQTLGHLRRRHRRLDHLELVPVSPGQRRQVDRWTVDALEVPHGTEAGFPTYAWRLRADETTLVYASDVAETTASLRRFASRADPLVVDGAMYRRGRLNHLRIDEDLPVICDWPVGRILLTQIGRSAPPHPRLVEVAAGLCSRAEPAYDGMVVDL